MVRPPAVAGGGIPPQPGRPGPHLHCAAGFRARGPPTRARVRLLGPCFKTGRVGHRRRRGPLAPVGTWALPPRRRGAAGAHWAQSAPVDSRAGSGGPRPPSPPRFPRPRGAGGAERFSGGRARRRSSPSAPGHGDCSCLGGAVTPGAAGSGRPRGTVPAAPGHLPPLGLPSRPGAGRGAPPRRKCALRGPDPPGPRPPRRAPPRAPRGVGRDGGGVRQSPRRPTLARRVESSGRTARTPPVYLLTVSRPLELSLQSSFQLSLTVLVRYRSRARV